MKTSPFERETSGGGAPPAHPVSACLDVLEDALASVTDARCWSLSADELADLTRRAGRVLGGVTELRLRLIAAADVADIGAANGATSTAAWLANSDRVDHEDAASDVALAKVLDSRCEATRTALAAGRINSAQAKVITRAVTDLPGSVGESDLRRAESHLVAEAATFAPRQLRNLGRRIIEVIDPDAADEREGKAFQAEEERARRVATLSMRRLGDGTTRGAFRLPDAQADMLRTWCEAVSAPRRGGLLPGPAGSDPDTSAETDVPYPVRMGRALGALAEHLPVDGFSARGAIPITLTVDIEYAKLRDEFGAAVLSTGTHISAGQARRLACNAGLLPITLDGASRILDLGTAARLFDRYQRIALARRDNGCVWPGCDRPPAWCEAHHVKSWADGGPTDLSNGCLLCVVHHHMAHGRDWQVVTGVDGVPEVIPPGRVDPMRRPRRHARFRQRSPGPA